MEAYRNERERGKGREGTQEERRGGEMRRKWERRRRAKGVNMERKMERIREIEVGGGKVKEAQGGKEEGGDKEGKETDIKQASERAS